jgi:hypothetical protein
VDKRVLAISAGVGAVVLIWAGVVLPNGSKERADEAAAPAEAAEPELEANEPAPSTRPAPSAASDQAAAPEAEPARRTPTVDYKPPLPPRPELMGPFDELKASYERDARDPEAGATEERIRVLLKHPDIPDGMLRSVSCVKSTCKLELRWTTSDGHAYMILMMSLVSGVSEKLAAAPVGEDQGQPVHTIEVYVSRIEPPVKTTPE